MDKNTNIQKEENNEVYVVKLYAGNTVHPIILCVCASLVKALEFIENLDFSDHDIKEKQTFTYTITTTKFIS
jgi:hypothetical protein